MCMQVWCMCTHQSSNMSNMGLKTHILLISNQSRISRGGIGSLSSVKCFMPPWSGSTVLREKTILPHLVFFFSCEQWNSFNSINVDKLLNYVNFVLCDCFSSVHIFLLSIFAPYRSKNFMYIPYIICILFLEI